MVESLSPVLWGDTGTELDDLYYGQRMQALQMAGASFVDSESVVNLATSNLSNQEMMDAFNKAHGTEMVVTMREQMEGMPDKYQQGEFARLPQITQDLLTGAGYKIPEDEKQRGLMMRMATWDWPLIPEEWLVRGAERLGGGFLSATAEIGLAPVRAVGWGIGKVAGTAWEGVEKSWRWGQHAGRSYFGMVERHPEDWNEFLTPSNWYQTWNETTRDNDSYTTESVVAAIDLIGEERVELMRLYLREGRLDGVFERVKARGEADGRSENEILDAFNDWMVSLDRPAEKEARQLLTTGKRNLSAQMVQFYNQTPVLPDVRPGTAPAAWIGGVSAFTVEVFFDPLTWVGFGWKNIVKLARPGYTAVTTPNQVDMWRKLTDLADTVDDLAGFRQGIKEGVIRVDDVDVPLRNWVQENGQNFISKLNLVAWGHAKAQNKMINNIIDTFRKMDDWDELEAIVKADFKRNGLKVEINPVYEEMQRRLGAELGIRADRVQHPLVELLRKHPNMSGAIPYMQDWHTMQRGKIIIKEGSPGFWKVGDAVEPGSTFRIMDTATEDADPIQTVWEAVQTLNQADAQTIGHVTPTLSSRDGYWNFLLDSLEGKFAHIALGGVDPSIMYMPRIGVFGSAWVKGRELLKRPIDFHNMDAASQADIGRLFTNYLADRFTNEADRILQMLRVAVKQGDIRLADNTLNKLDEDMLVRLFDDPTLATADEFGIAMEDVSTITDFRAEQTKLITQDMIDNGQMDGLLTWHTERIGDYEIGKMPKRSPIPGTAGFRTARNYYTSKIHPPGSINDEVSWLEKIGAITQGTAMGLAYYPAKFANKLTTYVPKANKLDVLDKDTAIKEFTALLDMGALAHMPRSKIDYYLRLFVDGTEGQRWLVQTEFLLDFMGRSGAAFYGGPQLDNMIKKFIRHGNSRYSFIGDDFVSLHGVNLRRAVTPGVEHGAHLSRLNVIPDYRELAALTREMSFYHKIGWANRWVPKLDGAITRIWRPAVLLRLGYVARNGGEEMFSWLLREGPKGYMTNRVVRQSMNSHIVWDEFGRKIAKEVPEEEQIGLAMRGVFRVWRSVNELAGFGDFSVTVRAINKAMLDPARKGQWAYLNQSQRLEAMTVHRNMLLADKAEMGMFARFSRERFKMAEQWARGISRQTAAIRSNQGIPSRRMIAEALGKGFLGDPDFALRRKLIRMSWTQPVILDSYMKNLLSTFDTYSSFENMRMDSMLRKAGFGRSTQDMFKLPMNYESFNVQTVSRDLIDTTESGTAVTQKLTHMAENPGAAAAANEQAHYIPATQDAVDSEFGEATTRLIASDPEFQDVKYVGTEAVEEVVILPEPDAVIEEFTIKMGYGSVRERMVAEQRVDDARRRGDVIEVELDVRPTSHEHGRKVTMRMGTHLERVHSGEQISDTRLVRDTGRRRPIVGEVLEFTGDNGSVFVVVESVKTIPHQRTGMAWVRRRTEVITRPSPEGEGIVGTRKGREVVESHPINSKDEFRGRVPWLHQYPEGSNMPSTPETLANMGFKQERISRTPADDIADHARYFVDEGFDTVEEYTAHMNTLTERGGQIIRTTFRRIDTVEDKKITVRAPGAEGRVISAQPAVPKMTPSEFIYRYLHENHPELVDLLETAVDQAPTGRIVFFGEEFEEFDGSLDIVFEHIFDVLYTSDEEWHSVLRNMFLGTRVTETGDIIEANEVLTGRLLQWLLQRGLTPSRFSSDPVAIQQRMHAAYRKGMSGVTGQDMSMSTVRANLDTAGQIDSPLPPGYMQVYVPMVPLKQRDKLIELMAGNPELLELFERRLGERLTARGLDIKSTGATSLLDPQYGLGSIEEFVAHLEHWAAIDGQHVPIPLLSGNLDVSTAIAETLDDVFGVVGGTIVGRANVGSDTLKKTKDVARMERRAGMPSTKITQTRGGLTSTLDTPELAVTPDSLYHDPYYGWTPDGAVSGVNFPRPLGDEPVFGTQIGRLNPEAVQRIRYVDGKPKAETIVVYRHPDGRRVTRRASDERPEEWYEGWERIEEQVVTGDNLFDWIHESALQNVDEMQNLLVGRVGDVDQVQQGWLRALRNISRDEDFDARRIVNDGDWEMAPKRMLALLPASDEAGKWYEPVNKWWKTLIGNWFDGVVNPMISAMVREPMFQHHLVGAYQQTKQVRNLYPLHPHRIARLRSSRIQGAGMEDGEFVIRSLEDLITMEWLGATRDTPDEIYNLIKALENQDAEKFADALELISDPYHLENMVVEGLLDEAGLDALLATLNWDSGEFAEVKALVKQIRQADDQWLDDFFVWAHNRKRVSEVHRDVALQRAFKLTSAYIDDHRIRSQFQEMVGSAIPFWFAEDNFLRRIARSVVVNPLMLRNLNMTMNAGTYAGLIQENSDGDRFLIYPGTDLMAQAMLELVEEFPILNNVLGPTFGMLAQTPMASSINIIPGYDLERIGQMGFGPLLAAPIMWHASGDAAIRSKYDANLLGNRYGSDKAEQVALDALVPAIVTRFIQATPILTEFAPGAREKATIDVLAVLGINEMLPSQESIVALEQPELFTERFLHKVDTMAHQYEILQALTWFGGFSTGMMSDLVAHEGWEWQEQFYDLVEAGLAYEEAYKLWILRIEDETGEPFDPMRWSPFRASESSKRTFGVIEATQDANVWMVENEEFIEAYGLSSTFFMPRRFDSDDDRYSAEAKSRAINHGLRDPRTPAEYLGELYYQAAYPEYSERRRKYLRERYVMLGDGNDTTDLDRRWYAWVESWGRRNPVFASKIASQDSVARRTGTIEDFRRLLAKPSVIPLGLHTADLIQAMQIIVELADEYAVLKHANTRGAQERRDAVRYGTYTFMQRFVQGKPWLNEMYYSVFLPLISETWLAKFEAGLIDPNPRMVA